MLYPVTGLGTGEDLFILDYFLFHSIRSSTFSFFFGQRGIYAGGSAGKPMPSWRGIITPAKRGKGARRKKETDDKTPAERHATMTWAQRLKRVFNIDMETCPHCGGPVKVIACIEEQQVIDKILAHLKEKEARAPPILPSPGLTDVTPT